MEEINKRSGSGASVSLILCFTDGHEVQFHLQVLTHQHKPVTALAAAWVYLRAHEGSMAIQSTGLKVLHTNCWVVANCLQMCWVAGNPGRWQYLDGCGKEEEGLGVPIAVSRTAGCRLAAAGVDGQAVRAVRDTSATCSGEEDAARGDRGLAFPRHWHPAATLPDNAVPSDASLEPWAEGKGPPIHSGIS